MRTTKPAPTKREICGTYRGWNKHNREREMQCQPCRDAQAKYMRELRHKNGHSKSSLYTDKEIAAVRAGALREAAQQAMWGAYGKNWLTNRADEIEAAA